MTASKDTPPTGNDSTDSEPGADAIRQALMNHVLMLADEIAMNGRTARKQYEQGGERPEKQLQQVWDDVQNLETLLEELNEREGYTLFDQ